MQTFIEKCKSRFSWNEWLAAIINRRSPEGFCLRREIYSTEPGARVEVVWGYQLFGSGCYRARFYWRCKDELVPEIRRREDLDKESQFHRDVGYELTLPDNCLVCHGWSDSIGREQYTVVVATSDVLLRKLLWQVARFSVYDYKGDPVADFVTDDGRKRFEKYLADVP